MLVWEAVDDILKIFTQKNKLKKVLSCFYQIKLDETKIIGISFAKRLLHFVLVFKKFGSFSVKSRKEVQKCPSFSLERAFATS